MTRQKEKDNTISLGFFLTSSVSTILMSDLGEQMERASLLEQERRKAEDEASRLEKERQAALLAKEELARQAEDQKKSQEQLVSISYHCATIRHII